MEYARQLLAKVASGSCGSTPQDTLSGKRISLTLWKSLPHWVQSEAHFRACSALK